MHRFPVNYRNISYRKAITWCTGSKNPAENLQMFTLIKKNWEKTIIELKIINKEL